MPNLLFKHLKPSGSYLDMRAEYPDTTRYHLPVGAITFLYGHQYTDAIPVLTLTRPIYLIALR